MKRKISFYFYRAYAVIDNFAGTNGCKELGSDHQQASPGLSQMGYGGAELNLINLAVEFAKRKDFEVTFYTGDYGSEMLKEYKDVRIKRIRFYNYEKYKGGIYRILRPCAIMLAMLADRSDVLITSTACEMLGQMALVSKLKKSRIIFRLAHDTDADIDFIENNYPKRFQKFYLFGLKNAHAVVAQNKYQLDKIRKMFPDKESVLISNSLGTSFESTEKAGSKSNEQAASVKKEQILWVARCTGFKRPELFVELAARIRDQKFVMIIPASGDEAGRKLQRAVKEMASGLDNIEIIDFVPFEEIMPYFSRAKLFVNTSEAEGFPNTFIQASFARTPILSFTCNPDDILNTFKMGYVCDNDIEKAVSFIQGMDEHLIDELGGNAYQYGISNHSIEASADKYVVLMDKIREGL